MAQSARKQSRALLLIFVIVGLVSLPFLALAGRRRSPQAVIQDTLSRLGISEPTVKFWTAVSAFETNGWTSRVFKDSNNLFCIIVPNSKRLQYGEGQTIFASMELSIDGPEGLYQRVLKPFKYPAHVQSIDALVDYMKSKNYFTSDKAAYLAGVKQWFAKLYPNG